MKHVYNKTPEETYEYICNYDLEKVYTYVIFGRSGPTGKTWLWNKLRVNGYRAVELTETFTECGVTCCSSKDNLFILDDLTKQVVIILNNILPEYGGKFK